jgi:hypothetical protein
MARRRKRTKDVTLYHGDTGPDTAAQMQGAEIRRQDIGSGAVLRYKRRWHVLELMHKRAAISARQRDSGMELHARYERTGLSPASAFTKVQVDTTPDWDAITLGQIERQHAFTRLSRHVPKAFQKPVWHVCIEGKELKDGLARDAMEQSSMMAQLQVALDILANELRL